MEAARRRKRVLFTKAADLVRTLLKARDDRVLGRLHHKIRSVHLLIIDEKLTTALLDRLGRHAHVLTTKGRSYRTKCATDDLAAQEPDTP